MGGALHSLVNEASWKLVSILRAGRHFTTAEMVGLYKSKLLSYIECRTPAIYHACTTHLAPLDQIQKRFLREIGVSELDALVHFKLAPLEVRRDIAMLGVIHRAVLGKGPQQLQRFFQPVDRPGAAYHTRLAARRHSRQLEEMKSGHYLEVMRRSALGLRSVYNLLPEFVVSQGSVKGFQGCLQCIVKDRVMGGHEDWRGMLSPRKEFWRHPLR